MKKKYINPGRIRTALQLLLFEIQFRKGRQSKIQSTFSLHELQKQNDELKLDPLDSSLSQHLTKGIFRFSRDH